MFNPLLLFVAILAPAMHGMVENNVAWLVTMFLHAVLGIQCSVSLLVAPSGLE